MIAIMRHLDLFWFCASVAGPANGNGNPSVTAGHGGYEIHF
jgi:hypothetical protein